MADEDNRNRRNTGRRNRVRTGGAPAIIVLEPPAEYDTIDLSSSDSLKLWLINRVFFYAKKEGSQNWKQYWNSLEGFVIKPEVNGDKKHQSLHQFLRPIANGNYKVFFSQRFLSVNELNSAYNDLIPDVTITPSPPGALPIPYPNIANGELNQNLSARYLNSGIRLLKIPYSSIKKQFSLRDLDYWIRYVYENSLDPIILDYYDKEETISTEKVVAYITQKVGPEKAYKKILGSSWEYDFFNPHEGKDCFLRGFSTGSMLITPGKKIKTGETISSELVISQMRENTTAPIDELYDFEEKFEKFRAIFEKKWKDLCANDEIKVKSKPIEEQIKTLQYVLIKSLGEIKKVIPGIDNKSILKYFWFSPTPKDPEAASSEKKSIINGVANIASRYEGEKTETTKYSFSPMDKTGNYLCSWKKVFFASGSDAYSEEKIPRHVFQQLLDWWNNLEKARKAFISSCSCVEVIGFSSKKGYSKINERLRLDRAWKTANSLQLILKKECGIDASILEVSDSDTIHIPEENQVKMIYYRSEPLGSYPIRISDEKILTDKKESAKKLERNRPSGDDAQIDRSVTIIFHKKIPQDKVSDRERSKIGLYGNSFAFPVSRVTALATVKDPAKDLFGSLVYMCPATFDDEGQ